MRLDDPEGAGGYVGNQPTSYRLAGFGKTARFEMRLTVHAAILPQIRKRGYPCKDS
jgi:hypothetical protein